MFPNLVRRCATCCVWQLQQYSANQEKRPGSSLKDAISMMVPQSAAYVLGILPLKSSRFLCHAAWYKALQQLRQLILLSHILHSIPKVIHTQFLSKLAPLQGSGKHLQPLVNSAHPKSHTNHYATTRCSPLVRISGMKPKHLAASRRNHKTSLFC